ncbi:MAG: hypothetical protein IKF72_15435 [Kiritimatiellae bacterium]|nr:hypothetical protein [Kiritimatiellia bacterium]
MVTVILAIAAGGGVFAAAYFAGDWGTGWSVFAGIVGFGVVQGVAGHLIQKRVKREMEKVQAILLAGQKQLQQKMQRWQLRPPGSVQAAQKEIAADTRVFVRQALEQTKSLERFRLWVPLMGRQIATARLQLCWMIKDFKAVDELMPKAICIDPTMSAIKMARMYMLDRPMPEIEKVYRKGVARVRYNGNVLLAAAMSWMQVKKGDADGAFKTLTEALKKSDDATLKQNHEQLMNNRVAHFSNSGLGDQWYSLLLEEPRMHVQRQRSVYR